MVALGGIIGAGSKTLAAPIQTLAKATGAEAAHAGSLTKAVINHGGTHGMVVAAKPATTVTASTVAAAAVPTASAVPAVAAAPATGHVTTRVAAINANKPFSAMDVARNGVKSADTRLRALAKSTGDRISSGTEYVNTHGWQKGFIHASEKYPGTVTAATVAGASAVGIGGYKVGSHLLRGGQSQEMGR